MENLSTSHTDLDVSTRDKLRSFKNKDIAQLVPKVPCKKCRATKWFQDTEPLSWKCAYCGNTSYYIYGTLKQQIDILVADDERGSDFVQSIDGKSYMAKRSEEVKMLRFGKTFLHK